MTEHLTTGSSGIIRFASWNHGNVSVFKELTVFQTCLCNYTNSGVLNQLGTYLGHRFPDQFIIIGFNTELFL